MNDATKELIDLLKEGYILVNATGMGVVVVDKLKDEGYKVVGVYPAHKDFQ